MSKKKLLLATNNHGKLEELRVLLANVPFELVSPSQIGLLLDVDEYGKTYATNANIKAKSFAKSSGLLTLADDSGLEVEALNNAPGVHSARYAGLGASDAQRIDYLLLKLKDVPFDKRLARFVCFIAISYPNGNTHLCSGSCRGTITTAPHGTGGFGYDPVFYFCKFGKTMSELSAEMKNRISHRARAAARASRILAKMA
ncbi:MAG: XTP/dITP diphosphatase [Dehalococcoidia bacterium]|nr:XTP/dITP diphosphatase [Dehalococcoidia bacterium]